MIDPDLLETLLNGTEGSQLDFKREQYRFIGASDLEKSELLKDVLAFANAWKTGDAYIVLGAIDGVGARATVVGVASHIDDASLQQFVNSKTNRKVNFSYEPVQCEGKSIAVIRIDCVQARPIYLLHKYGKVEAKTVYIRRGSSTAIADAEEQEGIHRAMLEPAPSLSVQFMDAETGEYMSSAPLEIRVRPIEPMPPEKRKMVEETLAKVFPKPLLPTSFLGEADRVSGLIATLRADPFGPSEDQRREHEKAMSALKRVVLIVKNTGRRVAKDVTLQATISSAGGLLLTDEPPPLGLSIPTLANCIHVSEARGQFELRVRFGKIQPGAEAASDPMWIGGRERVSARLVGAIFADELHQPIPLDVAVQIRPRPRYV